MISSDGIADKAGVGVGFVLVGVHRNFSCVLSQKQLTSIGDLKVLQFKVCEGGACGGEHFVNKFEFEPPARTVSTARPQMVEPHAVDATVFPPTPAKDLQMRACFRPGNFCDSDQGASQRIFKSGVDATLNMPHPTRIATNSSLASLSPPAKRSTCQSSTALGLLANVDVSPIGVQASPATVENVATLGADVIDLEMDDPVPVVRHSIPTRRSKRLAK